MWVGSRSKTESPGISVVLPVTVASGCSMVTWVAREEVIPSCLKETLESFAPPPELLRAKLRAVITFLVTFGSLATASFHWSESAV